VQCSGDADGAAKSLLGCTSLGHISPVGIEQLSHLVDLVAEIESVRDRIEERAELTREAVTADGDGAHR